MYYVVGQKTSKHCTEKQNHDAKTGQRGGAVNYIILNIEFLQQTLTVDPSITCICLEKITH
jgi:hypothetical protein